MDKNLLNEQIPQIYCAISIIFEQSVDVDNILFDFKRHGMSEIKVHKPKLESSICLDIAIINNERFWHLDEALTKMFSKIDNISQLKSLGDRNGGSFLIDIAFYKCGSYPSLDFTGENMDKIRFLEAEISIDAYG